MAIIETHAHLYLKQFKDDIKSVIERAKEAGVKKILLPNIDDDSIEDMFRLRDMDEAYFFPMLGLHPCSVKADYKDKLDTIYDYLSREKVYGVGEIGLDYYWDKTYTREQKDAFKTQMIWAKELGLPIAIHTRDSIDDGIKLVSSVKDERLHGVFHCFTGSIEQAGEIEKNEFYMGIGGVVTFKNGGIDKVLPSISKNKVVVETDSPYLSPMPYRGKRNESSYLEYIVKKISEVWQVSVEEVENITTSNAETLFFRSGV